MPEVLNNFPENTRKKRDYTKYLDGQIWKIFNNEIEGVTKRSFQSAILSYGKKKNISIKTVVTDDGIIVQRI